MSGLRFSPRWALSPRDWDIHLSWLEKSNTCPTRTECTIKGLRQRQEEEEHERRLQQQWFFLPRERCSISCSGTDLRDARTKPLEGLMYSGQLNQPSKPQGSSTSRVFLLFSLLTGPLMYAQS